MCFLSFCSALFVVGIVNVLLWHNAAVGGYYSTNSDAALRRHIQRQQQQEHRRGKKQRIRASAEETLSQHAADARAWEEAAAFGVYDVSEKNTNNNNKPHIAQTYSDMIEARRSDQQRQKQRKERYRSSSTKRLAGGIFYDSSAVSSTTTTLSLSSSSTWLSWGLAKLGLLNDQQIQQLHDTTERSIYETRDLPVEDFRARQQALINGWEKEGIFWDYRLTASPNAYTLPAPEPRAAQLVVIVMSTRSNVELRKVIRETWGQGHVLYFVVGGRVDNKNEDDSELEAQLQEEAAGYKDMLDTLHPESYRSLPYKLRFAYQFVARELADTKWVLKVDDDMFARVLTLEQVLLNKLNADVPFVVGKIVAHSKVSRVGKWAEYNYLEEYYPYWPKGSHGHVLSRPVFEYVANMSNVTYYQGEDTSLGIWLSESPLPVTWVHSMYFQNNGQCEEEGWIVIGHQLSVSHMRDCFSKLDEWLDHDNSRQRNYWVLQTRAQRKWMEEAMLSEERMEKDGIMQMLYS
jgi:hypothetical protein